MTHLTDTDLIPFGTHKDKPLIEVPDSWFKWFYKENKRIYEAGQMPPGKSRDLMDYIRDSFNERDLI